MEKIKKHKIMLSILIIGLIIRFIKIFFYHEIGPDTARDLLIARHIAIYKEFLKWGHHNAGITSYQPPFYYYILSFFHLIDDYKIIFLIFLFISSFNVYSLYYISLYFSKNKITAFLTSLLYIFSYYGIYINNLWSVYFGFQLFLLSLFLIIVYIKKQNNTAFFLSLLLSFITTTIHFEFLLTNLLIIYLSIKNSFKKTKKAYFLIILFNFLTFYYAFLTIKQSERINLILNLNNDFKNILVLFKKFIFDFIYLFYEISYKGNLFLTTTIIIFLFNLFTKYKKLKIINLFIILSLTLSFFPYFIIKNFKIFPHYLIFLLPFIFINLAVFNTLIFKKNKILGFLIFIFLIMLLTKPNKNLLFLYNSPKILKEATKKAVYIIKKNKINKEKYSIVENLNSDENIFYPGLAYYYFLEKYLNKKILEIKDFKLFHIDYPDIVYNSKYIILFCRRNTNDFNGNFKCIEKFNNNFMILKGKIIKIEKFIKNQILEGYLLVLNNG